MKVRELVETHWDKSKFIALSLDESKISLLKKSTNFLDDIYENIPLRTRAYVTLNGMTLETLPKCTCGKFSAINTSEPIKGFRKYCGPTCSRKNKTIDKDSLKLLDDYKFLYQQKIIEQKSIEQIAEELNISIAPVVKYLKKYNLYQLNDARRRNTKANDLLQNKEKLIELYQNNTLEDIARTVGSTKATVSRWFKVHQIETKTSNSYERVIKKVSKEENQLLEYIQNIYSKEVQQSNRRVLNGKELDIYIPDLKIAIEYNGLYSHHYKPWEEKEALKKDSKYHLNKTLECEKQGIQLLQFYSDEWNLKQTIVQSIIQSKLNLNKKIYARKCKILEIPTRLKNSFLNQYHIQGEDKSSIKLGLFYEESLVALMTFSKSRFNKLYQWELTRFCVQSGLSVVGGFSKLLSFFRCEYDGSIISYADRRYSNGNVYSKNGFSLIHINSPSYYYVDKNFIRRVNRMRFQKKYIGAYDCTEYEKAREMGFEKIYDCGTLAYGLQ
jgi:hypothetical protein